MYEIFIIEVVVYIIGFALCLSSLYSTEWFDLSSTKFKSNITGLSFGLFTECISFVNGTNECSIYYCSNELEDFCVDINACKGGVLISTIAFLIMNIISIVRFILIRNIHVWQEGICTRSILSLLGIVILFGTASGIKSGGNAMPDLLNNYPSGVVTYTLGSGYSKVVISFMCAILCLILQFVSCFYGVSQNNQQEIKYQYLPPQYINPLPLFQDNNNPNPPPKYSSKD